MTVFQAPHAGFRCARTYCASTLTVRWTRSRRKWGRPVFVPDGAADEVDCVAVASVSPHTCATAGQTACCGPRLPADRERWLAGKPSICCTFQPRAYLVFGLCSRTWQFGESGAAATQTILTGRTRLFAGQLCWAAYGRDRLVATTLPLPHSPFRIAWASFRNSA